VQPFEGVRLFLQRFRDSRMYRCFRGRAVRLVLRRDFLSSPSDDLGARSAKGELRGSVAVDDDAAVQDQVGVPRALEHDAVSFFAFPELRLLPQNVAVGPAQKRYEKPKEEPENRDRTSAAQDERPRRRGFRLAYIHHE